MAALTLKRQLTLSTAITLGCLFINGALAMGFMWELGQLQDEGATKSIQAQMAEEGAGMGPKLYQVIADAVINRDFADTEAGEGVHLRLQGVEGPLDVAAMNRASELIIGTHDFRAFCRRPANSSPDEPLVRRVLSARWERLDDQWVMSPRHAPVVRLTIRAQSFCHNMVRCLTSTMVAIGQGALAVENIEERLASLSRHQLPSAAPAGGLALTGVGYEGDD